MSVYEYVCRECKKRYQEIEPITEHDTKKTACPKCKSKNVDRIWGAVNVVTSKKS